nr:MAG TPA: hypothetical protein [Caudoviricetes sp.]
MIRNNATVFEVKSDYTGSGARLDIHSTASGEYLSMNNASITIEDGTGNNANRTYINTGSIAISSSHDQN